MTVTVNHSTPSDSSFSATGAAAWDANHTLSGLGTMAEQNANNVTITGGSITGVTGVGTVTSVSGTAPVSVAIGTTTPVVSLASAYGDTQNPYASKTANYLLAAPNGSAGVPTFRALVAADIPSLSSTYIPYTGAGSAIDLNAQTVTNIAHLGINSTAVPEILFRAYGDNNSSSRIAIRGYSSNASSSSMRIAKFRGTFAAPQAPFSGDSLGKFELAGYGTTSSSGYPQASYEGVATENWGATARGAKALFYITPNTTITQAVALTIDQDKSATFAGAISVTGHTTFEGVTSTGATGTGKLVYDTSPTLTTPALGTPSALVGTNITGTASGLSIGGNAATATNATTVTNGVYTTGSYSNPSWLPSVALTTGTITTVPSSSTDIVNKSYADSIASGVNFHAACQYATAAALPTNTYNNGASGVGATLTATVNGALTVDGSVQTLNNRVLVKNEVLQANNGVYIVTQVGSGILPYILTRATDYNTSGSGTNEVDQGDLLLVISGTVNANTSWVQQTPLPITIGTTAIVFIQFAAVQTYTAGTGLTLTTNQFSITATGTAGTYGSATLIPVITTNAQGQVTSVTTANNPQGTVTSVGFTGGIVSVATATSTPAFTIAGTSGGIPYFASGTTWATSAALAANALVIGGGAGVAPATTTTGTGVLTALGVNTGTAGAFVVNGGVLGTPSSGTVTNLTGTASININGTVGATTPTTGKFTTITQSAGTASIAPIVLTSGTNLTAQAAGAVEYDGAVSYFTPDATIGRGFIPATSTFRLTSALGTAITTISNAFGATSNIPLVSGAFYEIDIYILALKTTAGAVTVTLTNSAAPTLMFVDYEQSPIAGVATPPGSTTALTNINFRGTTTTTTAAYSFNTGTLATGVNHYLRFKLFLNNGTGTSLKIQLTSGTGSVTPQAGSVWFARRLPGANTGTFAA